MHEKLTIRITPTELIAFPQRTIVRDSVGERYIKLSDKWAKIVLEESEPDITEPITIIYLPEDYFYEID